MGPEDMELENVLRIERLLKEKFDFSKTMERYFAGIKENLEKYVVDEKLLLKINNTLYDAHLLDDIKEIEEAVKELHNNFWECFNVD